jgi:outer membrane lipoprotein-sorting protein
MKQRFLLFLLICFFLQGRAEAQTDFRPMTSTESFKKRLKEESEALTGIESQFTQTKYIRLLSEKIVSTGVFSYQKPDKVCLDYQKPVKYLIVINGNRIKIDADGKINTFDAGSNRLMSQMSTLVSACMTGNLDRLSSDYELTFKENDAMYWIAVIPTGSAKAYMKSVDIFLDKKDFSVRQLKITEVSDDYTEYVFTGQKKNIIFPDAKFIIK